MGNKEIGRRKAFLHGDGGTRRVHDKRAEHEKRKDCAEQPLVELHIQAVFHYLTSFVSISDYQASTGVRRSIASTTRSSFMPREPFTRRIDRKSTRLNSSHQII